MSTPPPAAPDGELERLFAAIPERNTGDCMLRTTQQHHVQLSAMADTKANIIITISSIVLTLALGRIGDPLLRHASLTLAAFTLLALLLAVLAVLPKYRPLRLRAGQPVPPQFNLLFFGHFAELPRERFLAEIATAMRSDGSVYETMARDTYALGWYLAHHKYRYLRLSYLFFLGGFLLACGVQVWRLVAG
ncbi:MAG TPA: Pycsar system effector family protein [Arenimonas sp.]|nr:Pycsar system effector family protein [Arenimonas sp.]